MSERFQVTIHPSAGAAIEEACDWIKSRAPQGANAWANGLKAAIDSLEFETARCQVATESIFFKREIRQLPYGKSGHKYRILFTIDADHVHVLFLRHYAQDWLNPGA